jgi:hypothetical protein
VAVVGDPAAADTRRVLRAAWSGFRPHRVLALKPTAGETKEVEEAVGLLAGKGALGPVTVYVCRNFACAAPLVGVEAGEAGLAG